jgi:hypothetical protein
VSGNLIGTEVDGVTKDGNGYGGVYLNHADDNNIGGNSITSQNVISGNGGIGVTINDGNYNVIQANYIGLKANGTEPLGNTSDGIAIIAGSGNTIGAAAGAARNVISANMGYGIYIGGNNKNNVVQKTLIGVDKNGIIRDGLGNKLGGTKNFGDNTKFVSNNTGGNGIAGVSVEGNDIVSSSNTVTGNVGDGIQILGGNGAVFLDDQVAANVGNGVTIAAAASGVTLSGDTVSKNQGNGVATAGTNTVFTALVATGNGGNDLDILGGTSTFTGSSNSVGSALQSGGGVTLPGDLNVSKSYLQTGGSFALASGILSVASGYTLNQNATLEGQGSIAGNVSADGTVAVGSSGSPGDISITGNYTQTSNGVLSLALGTPGSGSDQLIVSGNVALAGSLSITLLPSFAGGSFTLIDNRSSTAVSGTFFNLPQGALITDESATFSISYTGGDGNDVVLTSVPSQTTTTLTASPSPSTFGQSVTFKATVAPPTGSATPTGSVTFYDGSASLGTATLATSGGVTSASLAVSTLAVGNHTITAVYSGNTNYSSSTSSPLTQVVTPAVPTVTAVNPNSGPTGGGISVTITGTGFTNATAVDFGTAPATFSVKSDTSIMATEPAEPAGTVDIRVANTAGTSATSTADHFTFVPAPVVSAVSPASGSTAGGTVVTISGSGFTGASFVYFGSIAATFTVNSDSTITATSPPEAPVVVDVQVVTAGGTSATSTADQYTFVTPTPPVLSGPPAGSEGTALTNILLGTTSGGSGPYTVTINWGDGTALDTTSGSVDGSGHVKGTHTYTEEGNYTTTVTVSPSSGSPLVLNPTFSIADATLTPTPQTFSAASGTAFTGQLVATFTDADPGGTASDYQATVAWGDNTTSGATVQANGSGGFNVRAGHTYTHTYTNAGTFTVVVTIIDDGGSTATATSTANVSGASTTITATPVTITPTEGTALSGALVATFTDTGSTGNPGDYTVTINWGDGHSSSGGVATNGSGGFNVTGSNTYASEGNYTATISISSVRGATAVITNAVTVSDAPLSAMGTTLTGTQGTALGSVVVAEFTDPVTNEPLSNYAASIDWGDGNTSAGTVVPEGGGNFAVTGSNTYAKAGSDTISVYIADAGGAWAVATSTISVAAAAPVVLGITPLSGPTTGGTTVTIIGTGLIEATAVSFGGTSATLFQVNPDGSITAVSPTGSAGTVDVTVTTPAGTSATSAADQFTYVTAAPTVTRLLPSSGPTGGGTSVTVTGSELATITAVYFGGTPAASFTLVSNTSLTAVAPAEAAGSVDVTVSGPYGVSPTSSADVYTYVNTAPTVTGLVVTSGPSAGGMVVTITGTNLNTGTGVSFGSTPTSLFIILSSGAIVAISPARTAGPVDIQVTNPAGTSGTSPADVFTFVNAPTVTGLAPSSGPTGGGTSVTITGTGFTGATQVSFGSIPATSFTVNSATSISAVAPAQTAGVVDVTVTTAGGTSATGSADQFTYNAAAPAVTAVGPNQGPTAGATAVIITGSNFNGATQVKFGGTAAPFTLNSPAQITAYAPAESAGTVDVTVTNPYGSSTTSAADQFTYADTAAPVVGGLSATSGAMAGGTSVVITGTGFTQATQVLFGGVAATSYTVNSSTQITATAPPQSAGTVDVTVTTPYGTSPLGVADKFTYLAAVPTVTGLATSTGDTSGGTSITISGSNLTAATQVLIGTVQAAFTVNADNSLTATAPVQAPGTFDVTVVDPWGTSSTVLADQFTYTADTNLPTITGISPPSGPAGGGTAVTLTGTHFTGATAVFFGAKLATSFVVNSDTSLTAISPDPQGTVVEVTVETAYGISNAADFMFIHTAPAVSAVGQAVGPATGGTSVTFTGTNLEGATQVLFGATPATSFTVLSSTEIAVTAPAGTAGVVDIKATTPYGTSTTGSGDQFTYAAVPVPNVTALGTAAGPFTGGNTVTITGTGFTYASGVSFGPVAATSFTVLSDTQLVATAPLPQAVGTVDITVSTPTGTSTTSSADHFTYGTSAPAVSGLSVTTGPTTGGTSVVLTGTNFTGATQVKFGGVAASYTVNSGTQITATAPAGAAGVVDVVVTGPGGSPALAAADQFTYTTPAPTVTAVSPTSGPTGGGTKVTLTGTSFTGATQVLFGTTPALLFQVTSATSISAVSPVAVAGTVDVTVTTASGTSATGAADHFTATSGTNTPAVTGLSQSSGTIAGGSTLTISGTNLAGATRVLFGTTPATSFTVSSATALTAVVPAGAVGTVDVTVVTYGGISAAVAADHYTYTATTPTVTAVSPTSGDTAGGGTVTVTGTHFLDGVTAVSFGGVAASFFTVLSDTSLTAVVPVGAPGTVDVRVTNAAGTSATSSADHYTYTADPSLATVTALSPTSGPTGGGTSVTITGTNFSVVLGVSFGASAASSFVVNSATSITAVAPFAAAGTVDVTVTTTAGTSSAVSADHYTYTAAAPTVTAVSPASGSTLGGTQVTLTGTNLNGATQVSFGGTAATGLTVTSATQLTVTAPALAAGTFDVTVTTPYGTSATSSADRFTALAVPTVSALGTGSGPTAGGTVVTITGTNFTGLVAVWFGSIPASAITINSATQLTVTAPAAAAGVVDVQVTTAAGTSAAVAADQFTFIAPPSVTAISPTGGPTTGGTVVTLTGTAFTGATAVNFGSTTATAFAVSSDGTVVAVAPVESAGTVDVTAVSAGGTSATSSADHFIYSPPQLFAGSAVAPAADVQPLTVAELSPLAQEAIALWVAATGNPQTAALLGQTQIVIAGLPGNVLGLESDQTIWIDATADGHGWFLDTTPTDNSEFTVAVGGHELQAAPGSPTSGRVDLLTVLAHEYGHVLGLDDLDPALTPHDVETQTLGVGVRRLPVWPGGDKGAAAGTVPLALPPAVLPPALGDPSLAVTVGAPPAWVVPQSVPVVPAVALDSYGLTPPVMPSVTAVPAVSAFPGPGIPLQTAAIPTISAETPWGGAAPASRVAVLANLFSAFPSAHGDPLTWLTTQAVPFAAGAVWTSPRATEYGEIIPTSALAGTEGSVLMGGTDDALVLSAGGLDVLMGSMTPDTAETPIGNPLLDRT